MKFYSKRAKAGFTLIEIVIVVGIIAVLSTIVLASVNEARKQSRDKARLIDLKQLELSFKLYQQAFDEYPDESASTYNDGVEIGDDAGLANDMTNIQSQLPVDPLSNDGTYAYMYDTRFYCTEPGQTVIYITTFEKLTGEANADSVCGTETDDDAVSTQYILLLQ
ncbi:MAG: prepilin-type N-terminal cleavage/methylation domain-containing protein [Candidatus Azotimanducaceae bacterium]|jgi:prepilin-type N-terminal cleavage/methylation domain-containing protein